MDEKTLARFEAKFVPEPNSGCWLWIAALHERAGYGAFRYKGQARLAHRVSYEHFRGIIPAGLVLDHLCRTRCCVNPEHLEAVTLLENIRRGVPATGKNSGAYKHPERLARGLHHGSKTHPECLARGDSSGTAVLNSSLVKQIRLLRERDHLSYSALGRLFGVHVMTISDLIRRKTWAHI